MRFISCRPSPRKNLLRFSDRIRQEQRELKRFSIISISSLVLGSCLLYAWISKEKSEMSIRVQLYIIILLIRLLSVIRTVSKNHLLPTAVIKHQCHLNLPVADDFLFKKLLLLEHINVVLVISFQSENLSSKLHIKWWFYTILRFIYTLHYQYILYIKYHILYIIIFSLFLTITVL